MSNTSLVNLCLMTYKQSAIYVTVVCLIWIVKIDVDCACSKCVCVCVCDIPLSDQDVPVKRNIEAEVYV